MKQSKKVMFDQNLSVIVTFEGKELDLTDFCQKHPGGAAIIKQYRGKNIDDVIFNPKLHKHNKNIRGKLLSYAIQKPQQPKLTNLTNLSQKPKSKQKVIGKFQPPKPSSLKTKQKQQTEENYSVNDKEGSASQIPVFETQFLNQKSLGFPYLSPKPSKRYSWNTN